jgi:hypothetical protein
MHNVSAAPRCRITYFPEDNSRDVLLNRAQSADILSKWMYAKTDVHPATRSAVSCGRGRIAQRHPNTVLSYDYVQSRITFASLTYVRHARIRVDR